MIDRMLARELKEKDCIPAAMRTAAVIYKAKACGYIAIWHDKSAAVCWDNRNVVFGKVVYSKGLQKHVIELNQDQADAADMDYVYDIDGFEL